MNHDDKALICLIALIVFVVVVGMVCYTILRLNGINAFGG
jgi:hypothetical protein